MTTLVIGGYGDIDEFSRRVCITQSNDRDIDIGSFLDSLCISARVRDDDEAGFFKRASDVVGKIAGCESSSNGDGARVSGELQDSALSIGTGRDNGDVSWIVNSSDDAGCEDYFFPLQC